MPSGTYPKGSFYSSTSIDHSFFKKDKEAERDIDVIQHMTFLYDLIQAKIGDGQRKRNLRRDVESERKRKRSGSMNRADEEEGNSDSEIDGEANKELGNNDQSDIDPANELDEREDICYTRETDCQIRDNFQLSHIPKTICSMIAFACNRCHNGLALMNSVTFLASGVPQRVNDYLHSLGLTSSSSTANKCMRTLKEKTEEILRHRASLDYVLHPLITADNIDIMKRVHHVRVEEKSKIHHGSWAYAHFLPEHLQNEIKSEEATVRAFQESMKSSETAPIELYKFLPNEQESIHWKNVIKSQISTALIRHVVEKDSPSYKYCKKNLSTSPPPIDQIPIEKPDIMMFKMMAASDDSAGGVAEMLEQIRLQSGLSEEEYASKLRVIEGDHGTCKNIQSLIAKSFPANIRMRLTKN